MKRLWTITLEGTGRQWVTTETLEAMKFTHCFKGGGFRMKSKSWSGADVPTVIAY